MKRPAWVLVKNHPFVDGNKRIGFARAIVFLEINGHEFQATDAHEPHPYNEDPPHSEQPT